MKKQKLLIPDWTLVRDSREGIPYSFEDITIGTGRACRKLQLSFVDKKLDSGDYSILGMEHRVSTERKELGDLFQSLSRGRARFIREISRLNELEYSAVVVESEWYDMMMSPPPRSRMSPASVNGSIIALQIRYPKVHWWFLSDRYTASKMVFKILNKFWETNNE